MNELASLLETVPLTAGQQEIWLASQMGDAASCAYNQCRVLEIRGPLRADDLESSLQTLVQRNDALRTTFAPTGDTQHVHKDTPLCLQRVDLSGVIEEEASRTLTAAKREEAGQPFDLVNGPLLRARLFCLAPEQHVLVLTTHHIVCDGHSLRLLIRELFDRYQERFAEPPSAPSSPPQFSQYVRKQVRREWAQSEDEAFWLNVFADGAPTLQLPRDKPRPPVWEYPGACATHTLPAVLASQLKQLSARQSCTLFTTLLATWAVLLERLSGQTEVVIGVPVADRAQPGADSVVGHCTNLLPLRIVMRGETEFIAHLAMVRGVFLDAHEHQHFSFGTLLQQLKVPRDAARAPLASVTLNVERGAEQFEVADLRVKVTSNPQAYTNYDLSLNVLESETELRFECRYNTSLFAPATVDRWLGHFRTLLAAVAADPLQKLGDLQVLAEADRRRILVNWNNTAEDYPAEKCIHHWFEEQAKLAPETTAAVFEDKQMSYRELNERAGQVALTLQGLGIGPEVRVGICAERSLDMLVGLLGILKAGGAYVPLDPSYPKERLGFMLRDSGARVLLTQTALLREMPWLDSGVKTLCLDAGARQAALPATTTTVAFSNLAYVIYTSGSTGEPKGVALTHRNLAAFVCAMDRLLGRQPGVWLAVTSICFDISILEVLWTLARGFTVIIQADETRSLGASIADNLLRHRVTHLQCTPSFAQRLILSPDSLEAMRGLKRLLLGGEALPASLAQGLLRAVPSLLNMYGPTETTIWSAAYEVRQATPTIPIGRPLANTQMYILDHRLHPVPVGVAGELYIGGDGVARGYLNRPQLTAERFVKDPFSSRPDARLYRTGDRAHYRPDGIIEFLGRSDNQIKIRGFRVELGEIEAVLAGHSNVRECVVNLVEQADDDKRLVCYLVPKKSPAPGAEELKGFVRHRLPEYMVPQAFVVLSAIPLTSNGKANRAALPAPSTARQTSDTRFVAPRDEVESQLARIWEDLLSANPVGVNDNFFDLGGHSLLALRMLGRIQKEMGKTVPAVAVFHSPTLGDLANLVRNSSSGRPRTGSSLMPVQPGGTKLPFFLVHGAGGGMIWGYANLARHLGPDQPVYAFCSRAVDGLQEFPDLREMASHYISDLRALRPHGPYCLGGYCFGGNVALEIARRLREQGEDVPLLVLMNSVPPNSRYWDTAFSPRWMARFLCNLGYLLRWHFHRTPAQRREFIAWKLQTLPGKLRRILAGGSAGPRDTTDVVDLSGCATEERPVWNAHLRALFKHRTEPYSGRVVLLRSRGHPFWCSFDAAYGWRDYIHPSPDVRLVAGAHEQILDEPFVQSAGRELKLALEQIARDEEPLQASPPPQPASTPAPEILGAVRRPAGGEWNQTPLEYLRSTTLVHLFEAQVNRTPDSTALVASEGRLSFRELNDRAEALAGRLRELGVKPERLVGICVSRSWRMVAGILAILKAGGAYVPMDPAYPPDRISFMLGDAKPVVLLTEQKLLSRFTAPAKESEKPAVLCIDGDWTSFARGRSGDAAAATNLAYVIYTSGSTGRPKGVAIEHRSAVALMHWAREVYSPSEIAGVLAATSVCFDLSVFEMFLPLSWGGKIVLAENALALSSLAAAGEVTLVNTVPSAIRELLRLKGVPDSVRVINLAGEPLPPALVDQIYRETSVQKVFDLYGPSETTTYSTGALRRAGEPATIGRPLAGQQVYLLDAEMRPVPPGAAAEMYIGGEGLARGYLNRPELTSERFLPNPFKTGERLYRTGDLARWRQDGNLEFLGRLDHQVKIRGFRVELGEIESVLREHPEVAEAVVLAREHTAGDKHLSAYLVLRDHQPVSPESLRGFLKSRLPDPMVPSSFVFLEKLPLTPNGKVDRNALPEPSESRPEGTPVIAPRSAAERSLVAIWRAVLDRELIGTTDNFFELGGHSLTATQVVSRMREEFKADVPLSSVFEFPTIAALAERLSAGAWQAHDSSEPALRAIPRKGPLPASFVQERLWFLEQLQPGGHSYNVPVAFRLRGPLNTSALEQALDAIVGRHEALRTVFAANHGILAQVIQPPAHLPLRKIQLAGQQMAAREAEARHALRGEAARPFDLERGPLVRALLVEIGPADHMLGIVMHHTIADGWSLAILFRELGIMYTSLAAGQPAPTMPELPVQGVDFAAWRQAAMSRPVVEKEVAWWKEALQGAPACVALPTDSELPDTEAGAARAVITLPKEFSGVLSSFGQHHASTPFMICLAALALTLRRWTGQTDLVLGTVVAGRSHRELENVIGCFMNFLLLRIKLSDGHNGLEVLSQTRKTVLDAQAHQDCPFQHIVEAVNPKRRTDQNPLYNVGLLLQNFPAHLFQTPTLQAEPIPIESAAPLLDLRFEADQTEQGFRLMCEYKKKLFRPETIELLLASFHSVLDTLVRRPETKVSAFPVSDALLEQARAAHAPDQGETVAVTATFTAEFLAEPLRYWLDELGLAANVEFAPYGQVFQQLLDPTSLLARNRTGPNVVLARLEDWRGSESRTGDPAPLLTRVEHGAQQFTAALKTACARGGSAFLVCLCPPSKLMTRNPELARGLHEIEDRLCSRLRSLPGVQLITHAELFDLYPVPEYDDPRSEDLGHVPYTPSLFAALATMIARKLHASKRAPCKVIALDCDQTLWAGVCGEDGPSGVELDLPRRELQVFMRRQLEAGRLLCLCSKNNDQDVAAVFQHRQDMPLRPEHFVARQLNWRPKSENLRALARELNLGLESIVLVDDNPVECAEVAAHCPEAVVLHLPEEPASIPRFLKHCWVFDSSGPTREDTARTAFYRQNRRREALRRESLSLADFLRSLELAIGLRPMAPEDLPRVSQLTLRTNQFNTTTLRRTEPELLACQQAGHEILTVRVADRFGDYGLVGVVIYQPRPAALDVEGFLLSCRVLGKGVEHRMLAHLGALAGAGGKTSVDIHLIPSTRNQPARDFLERVAAEFRQGQNGGFVYSIPAELARSVEFKPDDAAEPDTAAPTPSDNTGARSPARYDRWRWLALEANDPEKILRLTKASTPVRARPSHHARPATQLEQQLCEIWQDLLHVDRVGIHDDFFEVGGRSLLAVRLFARIEGLTGKRLPVVTIFQAPTIAQLAERLEGTASGQGLSALIVPIHPQGARPPLFLVHGAGGDAIWGYANLARHLPNEQPVYGIQPRPADDPDKFKDLAAMAADYTRELRAFRPRGPYCLAGYCFGGNLAYEMARQLEEQGHEVAFLGLLDSTPEDAGYRRVRWWRPDFLYQFSRNLWLWLKDFRGYAPEERRSLVRRKAQVFARRLWAKARGQASGGEVDLDDVIDSAQFTPQELKLWEAHLGLLARHVTRPYPGRITVFRTAAHPLFSSYRNDLGWGPFAGGGVTVKVVAGAHGKIFFEPNTQDLAAALTDALANLNRPPIRSEAALHP